jgi:hypothetical protein
MLRLWPDGHHEVYDFSSNASLPSSDFHSNLFIKSDGKINFKVSCFVLIEVWFGTGAHRSLEFAVRWRHCIQLKKCAAISRPRVLGDNVFSLEMLSLFCTTRLVPNLSIAETHC